MKIDQVDVVAAFRHDPAAPLKIGTALAALAEANHVQITQLNVPAAAPANIPRFMLGVQRAVLQVALDRLQLVLSPPDHITSSPDEVFSFVSGEVHRLLEPMVSMPWMLDQWCGVVCSVSFPIADSNSTKAAGLAASALTKLNWPSENLKAFQLLIGKEERGHFISFTISGYEKRTAEVEFKMGESVRIDESDTKLEEGGVGVQLDVNNKATPDRAPNDRAMALVLKEVRNALDAMTVDLQLQKVIS